MLPPQPHPMLGTRRQIIITALSATGGLCALVIAAMLYVRFKSRSRRRKGYAEIGSSTNTVHSSVGRDAERRRGPMPLMGQGEDSPAGSPTLSRGLAIQR